METEQNQQEIGEKKTAENDRPHHRHIEQEHIPASEHSFPSYGHATTDFVTRTHGRSSHRMIDHEPGTF